MCKLFAGLLEADSCKQVLRWPSRIVQVLKIDMQARNETSSSQPKSQLLGFDLVRKTLCSTPFRGCLKFQG